MSKANLENKDKIFEIATEVRAWSELIQKQTSSLYGENLCGLCAISSARLFSRLKEENIIVKIAYNDRHCFLLTEDNYVVDVTATQFGFQNVITIEPYNEILCLSTAYEIKELHDSPIALRSCQLKNNWPYHQTVKHE